MMNSSSETCGGNVKIIRPCTTSARDVFQMITITLLSLLLPLAFLLLARLTTAHYLLSLSAFPTTEPLSLLPSLFLYTDGSFQYFLVAIVTSATLINSLTGKLTQLTPSIGSVSRTFLYAAWIFLCIFQVCVCLGIEGSIIAGVDGFGFGKEKGLFSRVIFFLGLHETMMFWSKIVVKPIVDDTLFGYAKEERWVGKVVTALSLGTLWWWRLRDEIEALVVVVEMKREVLMGVGVVDFVGWWLYYLTVIIGVVRVVKGLFWVGMILICRRVDGNDSDDHGGNNDEKV